MRLGSFRDGMKRVRLVFGCDGGRIIVIIESLGCRVCVGKYGGNDILRSRR